MKSSLQFAILAEIQSSTWKNTLPLRFNFQSSSEEPKKGFLSKNPCLPGAGPAQFKGIQLNTHYFEQKILYIYRYMLCIHCKIANKSKIHWFRVFWPKARFPAASLPVSTRPIGQTISPIGPTSKGQSNSPLPNGPVPFGPPPSPRQARSSLLLDLDRRWRRLERAGKVAGQRLGAEARTERRPASRAAGRGGGADPGRQRHCGRQGAGRGGSRQGQAGSGTEAVRQGARCRAPGARRPGGVPAPSASARCRAAASGGRRAAATPPRGTGQRRPAGSGKLRAAASSSARQQAARYQEAAAHYKRSN